MTGRRFLYTIIHDNRNIIKIRSEKRPVESVRSWWWPLRKIMDFTSYLNVMYSTNLILEKVPTSECSVDGLPDRRTNFSESMASNDIDSIASKYKVNYPALMIWVLLTITVLYKVREITIEVLSYIDNNLDTCFEENFCLPIVEMVLANLNPLCHLYFATFYRVRQKFTCYERATTFLRDLQTSKTKLSHSPLYLFTFSHTLAIGVAFLSMNAASFWDSCLEYYLVANLISLYSMIMTFYYIANRIYEKINEKIDSFAESGHIDDKLLRSLEAKHWRVGNLSVDVNHCYGPNLLFYWPCNIVQIITFLMSVTDYMNQKIHPAGALIRLGQQLMRILLFLCTIIYFSRTGTLMMNEAERTKVCIAKLKLRCEDTLNDTKKKLIKQFEMKLNARQIQLTASGFLRINMQLLQSFLGLILTYWIVLIQFRSNE